MHDCISATNKGRAPAGGNDTWPPMLINARTGIVFLYARTSIVFLNARTSIVYAWGRARRHGGNDTWPPMFINARTSIVFLYARTSIVVLNARTSIVMHACLRPLHAAEFYRISLHACMQAPTSCVPDVASMITYRYTILFVADIQSCTHALSLKQYFMCNKRAYMAVIYLHITTKTDHKPI